MLALAVIGWIAAATVMAVVGLSQRRFGLTHPRLAAAAWTVLVGGLAVFYAVYGTGMPGRRVAVASMMGSWGARRAVHLLYDPVFDRVPGVGGRRWSLWFSRAPATTAVLFSLPALVAAFNPEPAFSAIEYVAAAVWVVGFAGAATADRQRLYFVMEPANSGLECRVGLWRYLRRPDLIFEGVMWLAFVLFAVPG